MDPRIRQSLLSWYSPRGRCYAGEGHRQADFTLATQRHSLIAQWLLSDVEPECQRGSSDGCSNGNPVASVSPDADPFP